MVRSLGSLAAFVAALAGLLLSDVASTAAPKTPTKQPRSTKTIRSARPTNIGRLPYGSQVKGQVRQRRNGQAVYVVQARQPGSFRSGLMTLDAAVVTRARLYSQGFSGHIHNLGAQGAFVHYSMAHWRQRAVFTNSQAANQVAGLLRANGLSARVVARR